MIQLHPNLSDQQIPLSFLNFSHSIIVFNHPRCEIFHFGTHFANQVLFFV